jgi:hypothetical protein
MQTRFQEEQVNTMLGKRTTTDVRADDGTLIVAEGDTVTQEVVDRAEQYNKTNALLAAVGMGRMKDAHDSLMQRTLEFFGESTPSDDTTTTTASGGFSSTTQGSEAREPSSYGSTRRVVEHTSTEAVESAPDLDLSTREDVTAIDVSGDVTGGGEYRMDRLDTAALDESPQDEVVRTTHTTTSVSGVSDIAATPAEQQLGGADSMVTDTGLLGHRTHKPVMDRRGNVIIPEGDEVTAETIDCARREGVLDELRGAVFNAPTREGTGDYMH